MSSIDERIVKMTFDNSDFEGKISKTLQSLEKLNETLSKTGAADGLKEVNKALKEVQAQISGMNFETEDIIELDKSESKIQKFGNTLLNIRDKIAEKMSNVMDGAEEGIDGTTDSMDGLSSATETVRDRFSALNSLAQGIFMNIGSRITDVSTKLLKSLTLEPLTTGFNEYELKTNSISTILANTADKGETLDTVTKALNELNEYSDQTIYNFAQMTDNIGKFTAAGVGLEDSVAAIKGMSNLAAFFGVDATKAAGAMYQMSQALAAGKVQLMDWNSLQNAGMSGEAFQKALIRTSEVMGTGAEAAIEKFGSFRESLTKGEWLTSDVMIETLKQISGAYKESELRAQGFSATQAKAITDMANRANKAATEVRTITGLMDTMKETVQSGWAISWEHIIGDKDQATELLTGIKDGFESIIKPSTDARNKMLQFWNESGGRDAAIRGFTNIIQSMGKGLGAIGDAWKEVFPSMTGEKLTELSTKFRDLTYKFKMNDETAKKIKNTFKGVFDVFKTVGNAVGNVIKAIKPLGEVFPTIGSAVLSVTSTIGKFASTISTTLSEKVFNRIGDGLNKAFTFIGDKFESLKIGMSNFFSSLGSMDFSKVFGNLGNLLKPVGSVLTTLGDGLGKAIGTINFDTIMKGLQTASGLKLAGHIKDTFKSVGDISEDVSKVTKSFGDMFKSFGSIGKSVVETLGSVKESLEAWQRDLQASTLMKIAGAIALLAGSLLLLSSLDAGQIATGLTGVVGVIAALLGAYVGIIKAGGAKGLMGINGYLITMATSLTLLSLALKLLSTISIEEMLTGLTGLGALIFGLSGAINLFDEGAQGMKSTATSLIVFGVALMSLALALKLLGSIDAETMGSGLFSLGALLLELSLFLKFAKFDKIGMDASKGILVFSAAMAVFALAVKTLGELDTNTILRGLSGIAAVMTGIALFNKFGGEGFDFMKLSTGLIAMGAAMMVMSLAIKSMASNDWETLARGLTGMAGAISILGIAAEVIDAGDMTKMGLGMAVMGASLLLISAALNSMSGMTWEELAVGLTAMAGAIAILGIAAFALSEGGLIAGAAAILVLAAAMAILTPQILAMSMLSWEAVAVGLTMLAGSLAILGIAALAAEAVAPGLLILAATAAIIGAGCALAGVGLAAMGTGLATIAGVIAASGFAVIEFLRQLINLLPQIGLKAGEAMVNFAGAIANGAPQIIAAFSTLLTAILTAIQQNIPLIAQTGMDIILAFAAKLAEGMPQLVTYGMQMVTGVLEGIAANIGQLVDAGIDVCVNFINGVADRLGEIIDAGINLALSFIEGVADGISNNKDRLEAAIEKVIQAMVDAGLAILQGGIDGFVSGGEDLTQGLIDGIESLVTGVSAAAENLIDEAVDAVGNCGTALYSAGESLVKGFCNGIESALSWVGEKASQIASKAKAAAEKALGINSPSRVFIQIGKYVDQGFVNGLERYSSHVAKAATGVAEKVVDNFSNPLSSINSLIDSDIDMNPVITPVLDLSNIQANSRRLNSMMPGSGTMTLSTGAANIMASSMGKIQNGVSNGEIVSAIKDLKDNMTNSGNTTYNVNGITYDDGSNIVNAVETLVRAARIERRI